MPRAAPVISTVRPASGDELWERAIAVLLVSGAGARPQLLSSAQQPL
jgi:hypothetical protein